MLCFLNLFHRISINNLLKQKLRKNINKQLLLKNFDYKILPFMLFESMHLILKTPRTSVYVHFPKQGLASFNPLVPGNFFFEFVDESSYRGALWK